MTNTRLLFTLAFTLAACGDDPIGLHDVPGAFSDAQCDQDVACSDSPDAATCDASQADATDNESLTIFADVDAGIIKYNAGKAQACLDSRPKGCAFQGFHTGTDPNPCNEIFTGTVAMGGACVIDQECAGGASCTETDTQCDRSTVCCPGTCGMAPPARTDVAIGGACDGGNLDCGLSAYCKFTSQDAGVCTALITAVDAPCDELDSCANPMICNVDFFGTGTPATCRKPAGRNETCKPDDLIACADSRDYCDATMKCSPAVAVGGSCASGESCIGFASCENSMCVAMLKAGEACSSDTGPDCLGDLACLNGTCGFPPAGVSCK